jgi:hypothetical protein
LDAFHYQAPFDPSMMVHFRRRLPAAVVNDCNERIVRHAQQRIDEECQEEPDDPDDGGESALTSSEASSTDPAADNSNQGTLLIDATCVPSDIRHPTDLSLLNEARETTKKLIDEMHRQVRDAYGHKPRTHRRKARRQFLAVARQKRPRRDKIRKAIGQQLRHLERNLASIAALIACGASLLAAGRHWHRKLLVASELVRQQRILYHSECRSIQDRMVSLTQPHIRPIVRGKARNNVEF